MIKSNLPPGCASPDGGIDYAFDDAVEKLVDKIPDVQTALLLSECIPAVKFAYEAGFADGKAEEKFQQYDDNDESWLLDYIKQSLINGGFAPERARAKARDVMLKCKKLYS